MRTVSETLEAAQYSSSRTPYIHMLFTSKDGGSTEDFSSDSAAYGNRILLIDHSEEAYNDYAVVILKNYDRAIPSLLGYWTDIGYGDVTGGGNEYSETSRLWVKHQQFVSAGGKLLCILELEGKWAKLRETLLRLGSPPYYIARNIDPEAGEYDFADATIYGIIEYLIENEILPAMTLAALAEDDGIINTLVPNLAVNSEPDTLFASAGEVIYSLIKMTLSFLKPKPGLDWEIKYPQDSDIVDLTYYSGDSPYFYEYTERENLLVPNKVLVFANEGDDELWTEIITAEADDTDSQALYDITYDIELAPELDNQTDADNRAQAILQRWRAEWIGGRLIIPHDCQMELYDRLSILDRRGL